MPRRRRHGLAATLRRGGLSAELIASGSPRKRFDKAVNEHPRHPRWAGVAKASTRCAMWMAMWRASSPTLA
jgi:hypothetical protein